MYCEDCGFPIDEFNDSQPVCPRCGGRPAEAHLNPADIDCIVVDALAASRAQEREAHMHEFELEQPEMHPPQIDDAEWAEEMCRFKEHHPAYTEFELLGLLVTQETNHW